MPRRYSMENRAGETAATTRQILAATVAEAATGGLDALTVAAVARRADVAVRTIYNHFGTRDELVAAAIGDLAHQTRAQALAITVPDLPPQEQVLAFVRAFADSYAEQGEGARVLMAAIDIPMAAEAIGEVRAWRRQQLHSMLESADADGSLRIGLDDAVVIAYTATAYATFATLRRDAQLSEEDVRSLLALLVERALFDPADRPAPSPERST